MDGHVSYFFLIALIPLITGFLWYNKSTFGNVWMRASGINPEDGKKGNMLLVFGLTYIFGLMICVVLWSIVVHQMGFAGMLMVNKGKDIQTPGTDIYNTFHGVMDKYGRNFRTFRHGALHGTMTGLFIALPIVGIIGLFERKRFAYIAVHAGYWILTLALMGGAICQFI